MKIPAKTLLTLTLALCGVCASGCGRRVVFVRQQQTVRLAKDVKASIFVPVKESGRTKWVDGGTVTLPAGGFYVQDPGEE